MPNGREHRKYKDFGLHEYASAGTSNCAHGCGCWAGPARSGGPVGVDPFGLCPNHHLDELKQTEKENYEDLVEGRIRDLEAQLFNALKAVTTVAEAGRSTKVGLIKQLEEEKERVAKLEASFKNLWESLSKTARESRNILDKLTL